MLIKILGIILGIIMIGGGIQCIATPLITVTEIAAIIPVFIGIALILTAVNRFVFWMNPQGEKRDALLLLEAILSFVCGLLVLCSGLLQATMTVALLDLLTILVPMMVLFFGCVRISRGFELKKLNQQLTLIGNFRFKWGWEVALGVLLVIIGILSIVNPLSSITSVGMVIGIDILTSGLLILGSSLAF